MTVTARSFSTRRLLRRRILAGAIEGHQRFDQAHARILRLELHGFVDTRADAATAERDRAHLAARERAGRAEHIGLGALLAALVGFVEAQRHLGQRVDGVVDFLAAIIDGISACDFLLTLSTCASR